MRRREKLQNWRIKLLPLGLRNRSTIASFDGCFGVCSGVPSRVNTEIPVTDHPNLSMRSVGKFAVPRIFEGTSCSDLCTRLFQNEVRQEFRKLHHLGDLDVLAVTMSRVERSWAGCDNRHAGIFAGKNA